MDCETTVKKQKFMDDYLQKNLQSKNTYAALNDDDDGSSPIDNSRIIEKPKEMKPPVIILHTELTNPKDTFTKIQSWADKPVYFKTIDDVRHVYAANKKDFYTIQEKFGEINFKFQTFKPRDEIPKKMILKGIDKIFSAEDILEDLKTQLDAVIDVKQLTKTTDTGAKIPLNVFLVYFTYDTRLSVAKKVLRYCCFQKINLDYFRKSTDRKFVQCYNCQGHGHQCGTCKLEFKCVKCTDKHGPGACMKKREDKNAVCVNCNGNHPANYRGCPKAQEYLNRRQPKRNSRQYNPKTPQKINKAQPKHGPRTPARRKDNATLNSNNFEHRNSYADVMKQQHRSNRLHTQQQSNSRNHILTHKNNHQRSSINDMSSVGSTIQSGPSMVSTSVRTNNGTTQNLNFIFDEIDSLFGVSINELMNSINNFVPQYKQCTTNLQRKILMVEFLSNNFGDSNV